VRHLEIKNRREKKAYFNNRVRDTSFKGKSTVTMSVTSLGREMRERKKRQTSIKESVNKFLRASPQNNKINPNKTKLFLFLEHVFFPFHAPQPHIFVLSDFAKLSARQDDDEDEKHDEMPDER